MCVLIEGYGYVFIEGFQTDKKNPAHPHLNFKWIKKSRPHKHALSFTTNMKFYLVKWIKVKKKKKKKKSVDFMTELGVFAIDLQTPQ